MDLKGAACEGMRPASAVLTSQSLKMPSSCRAHTCRVLRDVVGCQQREKGGVLLGAVLKTPWCSGGSGVESCSHYDWMLHAPGHVSCAAIRAQMAKAVLLDQRHLARQGNAH